MWTLSYVPDELVLGRAFRARCPDCDGVLEVPALVAEEEVDRSELGTCLSAAARRLTFPAFDGDPVDVAMPLSLSAVF